ncbi:MAG: 4'-phosphopantetheinyl transferase family protein [Desulfovibrio sp.]
MGVELKGRLSDWHSLASLYVTEKEHDKANRFVHEIDGIRHLMGRAIVRHILMKEAPHELCDFSISPYGKPTAPWSNIHFSISHSGSMVVAAFCKKSPVGIDIEKQTSLPELAGLAAMFHPSERDAIRACTARKQLDAFYRCWVRKEAVLKAYGEGLSRPLQSFCVHTRHPKEQWIQCITANKRDNIYTYDIQTGNNYHCSIATRSDSHTVTSLLL